MTVLIPERTGTRAELQERCMDFAKRMVFKGYENLTLARKEKLWSDVEWFLTDVFEAGASSWDQDEVYACDWIHERFEKYEYPSSRWEHKVIDLGVEPKYFRMLSATCRCAVDLFDDFAGGVWGWTVGDIKRMYDGKLPDWFPTDWQIMGNGPAPPLKDTDRIAI